MANETTMQDLFIDEIRDLYDAEKQLTKALPKMAKNSTSERLRQAFEEHLRQTEGHVQRLETIFNQLDKKASGKKCKAMSGMIDEGEDLASDLDDAAVRDAGLISAAQKAEHYEISAYGSARTHARMLGLNECVRLLEQTLQEEKMADQILNDIAESSINEQAVRSSGMTRTAGSGSTTYE